jgi:uncharacterized membrane protein YcaP (DUF421 family)
MPDLFAVALRASLMFLYLLAVLRVSGKRSLHHLSPIDFVLATAVGDLFDDVLWAEVPLAQGVVGVTTLVLVPSLVGCAAWKWPAVARLVGGGPTTVLRDGRWVEAGLRQARTPQEEVRAALRTQGAERLEDLGEVLWEPSGALSVIKTKPSRCAEKRDRHLLPGPTR